MRFFIKNIGCVSQADLQLDGITVVTGGSGSGKSSVCLALNSFFKVLEKAADIEDTPDGKDTLEQRFVDTFSEDFSCSYMTFDLPENAVSEIALKSNDETSYVRFTENLDPDCCITDRHKAMQVIVPYDIPYFSADGIQKESESEAVRNVVSICNGYLSTRMGESTSYGTSILVGNRFIDNKVNSAGESLIVNIRDLSRLEVFDSDTVFILDGIDGLLHPVCQVKLAEVLAELVRQFGIKVLVTTHSATFLSALEVYSRNAGIYDRFAHYWMEKDIRTKLYTAVRCETEKAYKSYFRAFQIIENARYQGEENSGEE